MKEGGEEKRTHSYRSLRLVSRRLGGRTLHIYFIYSQKYSAVLRIGWEVCGA